MLACCRSVAALLLAIASLMTGMTPVLAEALPPAGTVCAGTGHTHETRGGTPSVHQGGNGCGQCERGCAGPGQCATSPSLAMVEVAPPTPFRRSPATRYDNAAEPLRSTSAAPPNPPPQPGL